MTILAPDKAGVLVIMNKLSKGWQSIADALRGNENQQSADMADAYEDCAQELGRCVKRLWQEMEGESDDT